MSSVEREESDYQLRGTEPRARHVAAVLASRATVGEANDALRAAGWNSRIAGKRISIGDRVFARFVAEETAGAARWVVYGIGEMPPVWIVGSDGQVRVTAQRSAAEVR